MTNKNELILNAEQQEDVIQALLIGLAAFGEIERLDDEFNKLEYLPGGNPVPNQCRPIHPTGSTDTINVFATALRDMHQV